MVALRSRSASNERVPGHSFWEGETAQFRNRRQDVGELPIREVDPLGGGTDAFARPLSAQFSRLTGKQLIIDNRGGAGGTLGAGIAAISAMQGVPVRFKDTKHEQVARGIAAVRDVLKDRLSKRQITRQQFDDHAVLIVGREDGRDLARAVGVVQRRLDLLGRHAVQRGPVTVELQRRLRDLKARLPVIVMTAYSTVKNAVQSMRNGAYDYIAKPYSLEQLKSAIDRVIAGEQKLVAWA